MNKPMKIIAVKSSSAPTAKMSIPEYDANDIDLVLNMVNQNSRRQAQVKREEEYKRRLRNVEKRESDVSRRERIVRRKEEEQRQANRLVNIVLDAALIGFSILGMATAIWFWLMF